MSNDISQGDSVKFILLLVGDGRVSRILCSSPSSILTSVIKRVFKKINTITDVWSEFLSGL